MRRHLSHLTRNAEPLAFINDGVLQHMRVGGGAGIGTKYLSREDSHVVGMLGSGGMARTFLEAFSCVRDIKMCKVYSPTAKNREAYAVARQTRLANALHSKPAQSSNGNGEDGRNVDLTGPVS